MKAAIYTKYGSPDVIKIVDLPMPEPKANEVCIRVHGASVTAGDCELRRFELTFPFQFFLGFMIGWGRPKKALGLEVAGVIDSVGKDVSRFNIGDEVYGTTGFHNGAYAEYTCLPESASIALKPKNIDFHVASAAPTGAYNAYHFLRLAKPRKGEKLLVYGATGSIGTMAVQLARYFGAEVTAVCNTENFEWVKELGASHCIDYTMEDFSDRPERYDCIFEAVGKYPFRKGIKALNPKGRYIVANPKWSDALSMMRTGLFSSQKVIMQFAKEDPSDLEKITGLIESGDLTVVMDRVYSLDELSEAQRYVELGQKKGNVGIKVIE
jgi:NADPH:quinone reductase-like Zn-dependent oxidoreductase